MPAPCGVRKTIGQLRPPLSAVAEPGRVVSQLIDARIKESHELDLADRFEALRRHAHTKSGDQRFRQWRVENTLGAEALLQTGGGTEYAAIDADIFSKDHDIRIIRQSAGQSQIDCIDQCELRHSGPRLPYAGQHRRLAVGRRDSRTWFPAHAVRLPDNVRSPHSPFARTR